MLNIKEDREYFLKVFMEKMMIAERTVEEQGYYSEEEVEEELSLI